MNSFWGRNKDRIISGTMVLVAVYVLIRAFTQVRLRRLWFDELCTWLVTTLPTSSLWNALKHGADGMPPVYYVLESKIGGLLSNQQISLRLTSIFGAAVTILCLYVWLKRRYGPEKAFVASLLPLLTVFTSTYALEARPYTLITACLSLALLCYDHVESSKWTVCFALALLVAESLHYYAFLTMTPFAAAELLHTSRKREIRWPVWGSFGIAAVPLLLCLPILIRFKAYYGKNYWSKAVFLKAWGAYGWLFGNTPDIDATQITLLFAVALAVGAIALAVYLFFVAVRSEETAGSKSSDAMLACVFLLLPLVCYFFAKITNGGLTERYSLPTIFGFSLAAGFGLSRLSKRIAVLIGSLVVFCFASQEAAFWMDFHATRMVAAADGRHPVEVMILSAGHPELPVMVTGANDFLQLNFYAGQGTKQRLMSVIDTEAGLKYGIPDSADKQILVFRDFASLSVVSYMDFRKKYSSFLVCSIPFKKPWMNDPDWWTLQLQADGYKLTNLETDGRHSIYLAEIPQARLQ